MVATVRVEYVGLKASETDHLYATGITWRGAGDVQDVPVDSWEKMAKHTDVWMLAPALPGDPAEASETLSLADAKTLAKTLESMSDDELREFAKEHNIRVHHKQSGERLLGAIRMMLTANDAG